MKTIIISINLSKFLIFRLSFEIQHVILCSYYQTLHINQRRIRNPVKYVRFTEIFNESIFSKHFILDVWQDFDYASVNLCNHFTIFFLLLCLQNLILFLFQTTQEYQVMGDFSHFRVLFCSLKCGYISVDREAATGGVL